MKRMNSLPLSAVVFSYAISQGKPLPTSPAEHCSAKLVHWPFRALQFFIFIIIDKEGNSLPKHFELNILKFARISKFLVFTKPNKHKKKSKVFSTTWPNIFRILWRQSENFSDFC